LLEREYRSSLETAGFSVSIDAASVADDALLKTLLFASSMNVAKIKLPDATYTSTIAGAVQDTVEAREVRFFEKERVFVHPSSLLFGASSFAGKFLTFGAKQITSKPFIRNCSTLTTVGLLLFANDVTSEPHGLKTTIGDIDYKLKAFPKLAVLIRSMKQLFDSELANQFDNPSKFDAKLLSTL
jgi:ATP-dependent RNA helicase DHX57